MRRIVLALAVSCAAAAIPYAAPPESARTWVGREPAIEAHLKQARVSRVEQIGTGVTRPRRAWLDPGGPVASLTWKVLPPGRPHGFWESYKAEIAAYQLDALLAMHMVPPAVEREIDGEIGAAIMWVEGVKSVKQAGGKVPDGPQWGRDVRRMQMFDNLIGNPDRNAGNILLGAPGELILIDHSRAFITDERLPFAFERVDATLWTRILALSREQLASGLAPWLDGDAIDAILKRAAQGDRRGARGADLHHALRQQAAAAALAAPQTARRLGNDDGGAAVFLDQRVRRFVHPRAASTCAARRPGRRGRACADAGRARTGGLRRSTPRCDPAAAAAGPSIRRCRRAAGAGR